MSLIKREPSPAQSEASRANSLHSTGPRSERGIEISSRNSLKLRPFSEVIARAMEALGERPGDFEQMHEALAQAMGPRDAWEAAWVQDIAILRWRVERLHRAEVGILAVRKQKLAGKRKRESMPASGVAALDLRRQTPLVGFTGLPDSPWKFQQVTEMLHQLLDLLREGDFAKDGLVYFDLLYGKDPGALGHALRCRFEELSERQAEGEIPEGDPAQVEMIADVEREIENHEQKQALYAAEHREDDPVRDDAGLLLPTQELDEIIRYETHLEDQIERKLRQFYARRREPVLRQTEALPEAGEEIVRAESPCPTAPVGV
jgi:hypothetical protein